MFPVGFRANSIRHVSPGPVNWQLKDQIDIVTGGCSDMLHGREAMQLAGDYNFQYFRNGSCEEN